MNNDNNQNNNQNNANIQPNNNSNNVNQNGYNPFNFNRQTINENQPNNNLNTQNNVQNNQAGNIPQNMGPTNPLPNNARRVNNSLPPRGNGFNPFNQRNKMNKGSDLGPKDSLDGNNNPLRKENPVPDNVNNQPRNVQPNRFQNQVNVPTSNGGNNSSTSSVPKNSDNRQNNNTNAPSNNQESKSSGESPTSPRRSNNSSGSNVKNLINKVRNKNLNNGKNANNKASKPKLGNAISNASKVAGAAQTAKNIANDPEVAVAGVKNAAEEAAKEVAKQAIKQKAKQTAKAAFFKILLPLLPYIAIGLVLVLLILVIIHVVSTDKDVRFDESTFTSYCSSVNMKWMEHRIDEETNEEVEEEVNIEVSDNEYIGYKIMLEYPDIENEEVVKALSMVYRNQLYATKYEGSRSCFDEVDEEDKFIEIDSTRLEYIKELEDLIWSIDEGYTVNNLEIEDTFKYSATDNLSNGVEVYLTSSDDIKYNVGLLKKFVPEEKIEPGESSKGTFNPYAALYLAEVLDYDYDDLMHHFFNKDGGTYIYKFSKNPSMDLSHGEGSWPGNFVCDDISMTGTNLSKEEFIEYVGENAPRLAKDASSIYDISIANNFNPELVVVRAIVEGFSPGGHTNNYWGIGCYNSGGACRSYGSISAGVLDFINIMKGYQVNSLLEVYSVKHYAYIGSIWYSPGSSAVGGCYYYPYISKYMSSQRSAEVSRICSSGTQESTTQEDQLAYSRYQIESMVNTREKVFGIGVDSCEEGNYIDLPNDASIEELGRQIAQRTVQVFDNFGYSQAQRGASNYVDCSSLIARAYKMFNINYFSNGYYGTTYSEKAWCQQHGVLSTNTQTSNLLPGDLLFFNNYGHVEMYVGNNQKFGAHTSNAVWENQVSVKTYDSGSAISVCRPLSVYVKGH